jgi:hypothetical protein
VNNINLLQFISPKNFITSIYLKSNIINHFTLNIQSCPFPCLKSCVGIKILVKTFRTTSLIITCQKKFITIIPTQSKIHYFIRVRSSSTIARFMCVLMSCKNGLLIKDLSAMGKFLS